MRAGAAALLGLALAACGAQPSEERATSNNMVLAPDDVRTETNASIIRDEPSGNAATEAPPPASEPEAQPSVAAIPARFHGRWDASREACARPSSEMRLVVGATSLRFYESVGQVRAVRPSGDSVAVDLTTTGEGETRSETRTLRLTADGRLAVESGGTSATRVRCPA
ncbi:MAG TPA: hypothetical protein VGC46_12965 [Allosphingosinicella sp.]